MLEYNIVNARTKKSFVAKVDDVLKDGWVLQGGVSCSMVGIGYDVELFYSQAVVRERQ